MAETGLKEQKTDRDACDDLAVVCETILGERCNHATLTTMHLSVQEDDPKLKLKINTFRNLAKIIAKTYDLSISIYESKPGNKYTGSVMAAYQTFYTVSVTYGNKTHKL